MENLEAVENPLDNTFSPYDILQQHHKLINKLIESNNRKDRYIQQLNINVENISTVLLELRERVIELEQNEVK